MRAGNPYSWANNVSNESTHVATLVTTDATVVVPLAHSYEFIRLR